LIQTRGNYHEFEKDYLTDPECGAHVFVSMADDVEVWSPEQLAKLEATVTTLPMVEVVARVNRKGTPTTLRIYVIKSVGSGGN